jgi:multidrug resistance protein, MATE family
MSSVVHETLPNGLLPAALRAELRAIVRQAAPMLVAQLASVGMMVIDTLLLGHYGAVDLAAIAVGGGLYISVVFALVGILQSLGPIAAHHIGAGARHKAVAALWQGLWLSQLLALIGGALLFWPDLLLAMSELEPAVESRVRDVLRVLALGVPAVLAYRTFASFANAIGRTRVLMVLGLGVLALHGLLAWALVGGRLWWPPLGAVGCAASTALLSGVSLCGALLYLTRRAALHDYGVVGNFTWPRWRAFGEFFRLGLPMGFSNFVEISSFTLIALFVAPLGAAVVAGHRIVANLSALIYMIPLAVAVATLARVGQAAGARDWARCRAAALAGSGLAVVVSTLAGGLLFVIAAPVLRLFTGDSAVLAVAAPLVLFVALFQLFDAAQTVFSYALRGLKVTIAPMLVHLLCFWGLGLGGGAWFAYRAGMGVAGFWLATVVSSLAAALVFGLMLRRALHLRQA